MIREQNRRLQTGLLGRRSECAVLASMIQAIRQGDSRTLVLRGEAGVGKTALLDYARQTASDLKVLRAVGVESEMDLPFAALHQLFAPMLDRLDRLPTPQGEALSIVFGLSGGTSPDQFLVGLAALNLLSENARERPLICVVDDAQWLDPASAQTVGFVARRLREEPVGLVFAERDISQALAGLPVLHVQGLRNGDARALLRSAARFLQDERIQDRIVAETRGNPLALLELPRGLTPAQLAGGFGLLEGRSWPGRVEQSFGEQLADLPSETRLLLLVAAAEPAGNATLVWRAAAQLGIGRAAAAPAETAGLLALGRRVTFRHPLVRSAVHRAASAEDRRSAHLALAHATDPVGEPDRRAWHLATAATGPDEEIASALEHSAGRAQARGGLAAAAAFLQRSVELTGEPAELGDRALAAAEANLQAGAFDPALSLLAMAENGWLDDLQHARSDLLRGQIALASGSGCDAPRLLLNSAKRLEPLNLELAREAYLSAWRAAAFAEREDAGDLPEVCRAARALPPPKTPQRPVDLLLDGLALLITEGRAAAAPLLRQASSAFASERVSVGEQLRWGSLATAASYSMWDIDAAREACTQHVQRVRDTGALAGLPRYLNALGLATAWSGDFAATESLIVESDEVTAATGAQVPRHAALLLLVLRGAESEASALIDATLERAAESGQGAAVTEAHRAAAILYNGLGRYDHALAAAQLATWDPLDLYPSMWALPELVEAAARCGKHAAAHDALKRLLATTKPAGTEFGKGIEARSRALLSKGEAAEELYRQAIDHLELTRLRPELARAHLLYGEWLRRESRRVDARTQLRTAHELFVAIGMDAFTERARMELLATGERVRRRTVETRDELTAQERQIAQLAGDGLSNPEIGVRLFISPRTVEWHLHKVFTKLGISSRRGLSNDLQRIDRTSGERSSPSSRLVSAGRGA